MPTLPSQARRRAARERHLEELAETPALHAYAPRLGEPGAVYQDEDRTIVSEGRTALGELVPRRRLTVRGAHLEADAHGIVQPRDAAEVRLADRNLSRGMRHPGRRISYSMAAPWAG